MHRPAKAGRLLRELGLIALQLLIFAGVYTVVAGAIFAIGFGATHWLRPSQYWEIAIAVTTFCLCLPALWLAMICSRAVIQRVPVSGQSAPRCRVEITGEEIVSARHGMLAERVAWHDLTEIAVVNEDAFPIGFQYWLLVGTRGTGAIVPAEAEGAAALLEAMQARLPGFDNMAVVAAMGGVDGAFRVWKKPEQAKPDLPPA